MASLFIKDHETNTLAERLAEQRGITKTAAVNMALRHELERGAEARLPLRERMAGFWARHDVSDTLGPQPDKAFFDDLSGDL